MLTWELEVTDLMRTRFALSPIAELDSLLRKLAGLSPETLPTSWATRLRPTFEHLRETTALDAVLALKTRHYEPCFTAPPPTGVSPSFGAEIGVVRATSITKARREIEYCLQRRPCRDARVQRLLGSRDIVLHIADALEAAWTHLLAPDWPQLRAIGERDITHRLEQVRRNGWESSLNQLNTRVRSSGRFLHVPRTRTSCYVPSDGLGITLVPSVLLAPRVATFSDPAWPRTLVYSARGSSAFWDPSPAQDRSALGALMGKTRARILVALDEPASTTQLAHSLGATTGAVGDHLSVLHRAGLVVKARSGQNMLYQRTWLGEALAPDGSTLGVEP